MGRLSNPTAAAEAYVSGMNGASKRYTDGVNSVTEAPTAVAARSLEKAKRNFIARIDSGYTASKLMAVSLESWKNSATKKGASRLGTGATEAKGKVQAYFTRAFPVMQQLRDQIKGMPNDTASDREARQLAWSRGMRAFAGRD